MLVINLLFCRTLGTLKGADWNYDDDEEEEEEEGEKLEQWVIAMEVEQSAEKEVEILEEEKVKKEEKVEMEKEEKMVRWDTSAASTSSENYSS